MADEFSREMIEAIRERAGALTGFQIGNVTTEAVLRASGHAELVAALKPFAAIAGRYPKLPDDYPLWAARMQNQERVSNQEWAQHKLEPVVKVGDLRAASVALKLAGET
jgi:hypothetical protein